MLVKTVALDPYPGRNRGRGEEWGCAALSHSSAVSLVYGWQGADPGVTTVIKL